MCTGFVFFLSVVSFLVHANLLVVYIVLCGILLAHIFIPIQTDEQFRMFDEELKKNYELDKVSITFI